MGLNILKYNEFLKEARLVVKRKYTPYYPKISKNLSAGLRNTIFKL